MPITRRAALCAPALIAAPGASPAWAQEDYPNKPVRMLVPFPPGQAADVFARVVADQLSARWPQRVVVENRAGGAGAVGMEAVARAPADGYTLGIGTSGTIGINPSVLPRLPYDALRDFSAVTNIFMTPLCISVHPSFQVRDIEALVPFLKANENFPFASAGPATSQHMTAEMFAHRAGVKMAHVPYRGSGPAIADLIAGNVQLMFDSTASALPHVRDGRARVLAVTTARRIEAMPDVRTLAETILPGFDGAGWSGIVVPAGTPAPIIEKVNRDVVAILRDPAVAGRITAMGAVPDPTTAEGFATFIRKEIAKWGEVARLANVRLEG